MSLCIVIPSILDASLNFSACVSAPAGVTIDKSKVKPPPPPYFFPYAVYVYICPVFPFFQQNRDKREGLALSPTVPPSPTFESAFRYVLKKKMVSTARCVGETPWCVRKTRGVRDKNSGARKTRGAEKMTGHRE